MLHVVKQNHLIFFIPLIHIVLQLLTHLYPDILLVLPTLLLLLSQLAIPMLVMQLYLLLHLKLGLYGGARYAPLVDVDDALRHDDIVVMIVQCLFHGRKDLLDIGDGLTERYGDIVPLHGLHVLHEVVNGEVGVVGPLVMARIQSH